MTIRLSLSFTLDSAKSGQMSWLLFFAAFRIAGHLLFNVSNGKNLKDIQGIIIASLSYEVCFQLCDDAFLR